MLAYSLIFSAFAFGFIGFFRTGQRVRWTLLLILGFGIFFTIGYGSIHQYLDEEYLSTREVWAYLYIPVLAKMAIACLFGEATRMILFLAFEKDPGREPNRIMTFVDNLGSNISKTGKLDTGKDHDLRTAIDTSIWLYLEKCESPRRLTSAIGRTNNLSTDARITLLNEIANRAASGKNAKPTFHAFKKRNRKNADARENLFQKMVKVALFAEVDLIDAKSRLRTLAKELDIELKHAQQIVQAVEELERLNPSRNFD